MNSRRRMYLWMTLIAIAIVVLAYFVLKDFIFDF
jgi:hypothetical protein